MSDKGLETNEEYMLQIGDTLISLDVIERDFICNLSACRGTCCIEGDAGAPITEEERLVLMKLLPEVWNDLTPAAREIIKSQGVAYVDEEGDLVTSIVGGKDCVFTCYGEDGMCMCAIENMQGGRSVRPERRGEGLPFFAGTADTKFRGRVV